MITFHESIFLWTLINFFILLFLVHKFALPSLYKLLDEREKKRLQLLAELEKNKNESDALHKKYETEIANIKTTAAEIIKSAEAQKEELRKKALAEAFQEKQQILESIKDSLHIEKKRFIEEMQDNAVDLVLHCTKRVIRKELNIDDHKRIIRQNVSDLEKIIRI